MPESVKRDWTILWSDANFDADARHHFAAFQLPRSIDRLPFPERNGDLSKAERESLAVQQTKPLIDMLRTIFIRLSDFCFCRQHHIGSQRDLPCLTMRMSIAQVIKGVADTVNMVHFGKSVAAPKVQMGIEEAAKKAVQELSWVVDHLCYFHLGEARKIGFVSSLNTFVRHLYAFAAPLNYLRRKNACEAFVIKLGRILIQVEPPLSQTPDLSCAHFGHFLPVPE